jgi:hypothetical protein
MGHRTYNHPGPESNWVIILACVAAIAYAILWLVFGHLHG